ncbi:MAG TPA: hypothetical protein PKW90_26435, partial [Myxococcota bacterium]|nr:hypothetical protein [Myxococcota bacterium]
MTSLSLLQQLRAALWPLLSYWLLNLLTFGLFTLSLMLTALDGVEAIKVMGVVGIAVGLGLLVGQLFAFFRVRTWLILSLGALSWGISFYLTVVSASAGATPVAILLGVILLLTPVAAWGGMWSLETNRSMWSLWLPLVWFTGAVLMWADKTGKDSSWTTGAKAAIWDPLSILALILTLFLLLAFLVSRESHRLKLWAAGPSAPLPPRSAELTGSQASTSLGSSFLLLLLAPLLAAGTALITPYFWRVDHDPEKGVVETDGDGVEAPSGDHPDKNGDRS